MALKIIGSIRAEQGYDSIINYLIENWTEREVKMFLRETSKFMEDKNPLKTVSKLVV